MSFAWQRTVTSRSDIEGSFPTKPKSIVPEMMASTTPPLSNCLIVKVIWGNFCRKAARRFGNSDLWGTVLEAIARLPSSLPSYSARDRRACSRVLRMFRAWVYRICPASVRETVLPLRFSSTVPSLFSSDWIWPVMVGWVRYSSSAALVKLPCLTIDTNDSSFLKSTDIFLALQ